MEVRRRKRGHHVHGHGAGDVAADVLHHERRVRGGKESRTPYRFANFHVAEHVGIRRPAANFVGRLGRVVVEDDG